jgi:C1A family cysteine protease
MTFLKSAINLTTVLFIFVGTNSANAAFTQKPNWVSQLPRADIIRMMGVQNPPTTSLEYSGVDNVNSNLPASIDWRNKDGVNYLGKVMNQGNCGSCVAFASVATLEGQVSVSSGMPGLSPTFSPQMLFACGGGACDRGWQPGSAASFLKNTGVADEACMPYTSGSTKEDANCADKCSDASSRSFKIADFSKPSGGIFSGGSIESVKAALLKGPLLTTLTVYEDFLTYSSGVYLHTKGPALGGHAVSLVGYDDAKKAWLVRNSWGEEFGENGYIWIAYADKSGIGSTTFGFTIAPSNGMIAVTTPSDRQFVSGKQTFTVEGDTSAEFFLNGASKNVSIDCVGGSTIRDQKLCSASIDTATLAEGRYEIYAQSKTSKVKSQVREFFVLNSVPKMEISFTAAPGVDLGQPVKDRPEFLVTTKSSSVPLQYVEFRVFDSNGKLVSRKGNEYVLEKMQMGWRSNTVPDGNYSILFHGEITFNGKIYSVDSPAVKIVVKNK